MHSGNCRLYLPLTSREKSVKLRNQHSPTPTQGYLRADVGEGSGTAGGRAVGHGGKEKSTVCFYLSPCLRASVAIKPQLFRRCRVKTVTSSVNQGRDVR